jgi:alpha-D-xyloside xylohydrolase
MKIISACLVFSAALVAISCGPATYETTSNGVIVFPQTHARAGETPASRIRLSVIDEYIIRVEATPDAAFPDKESLMIVPQQGAPSFTVSERGREVILSTSKVEARIARDGRIVFSAPDGRTWLVESRNGKTFTPIEVEGRKGWSWRTLFESPEDESFYGLGQQQSLELDHKGLNEELFQYNTKISVPFIVSSKAYGLLWDTYAISRWGNPAPYRQLGEIFKLYDKDGREGSLTGTYTPRQGDPVIRQEDSLYYETEWSLENLPKMRLQGSKITYEGALEAPKTDDYQFILYYAGFQKVTIGGEEVVSERWRPSWNPNSFKFTVRLEKGEKTPIRVDWDPDGGTAYLGLRVAEPQTPEERQRLSFWTEMADEMDYYFIGGETMDDVIGGYRRLTGKAPVMPKWAHGFWQSRERYRTQDEIVSTLREFRDRRIPVDNIVQDWQYWKEDEWGSHAFEKSRFPDPDRMLDDIHKLHGRYMISVWPKFYTNTANFRELYDRGFIYPQAVKDSLRDFLGHLQSFYDAYSADGRKLFWKQMDSCLYTKYGHRIDAWWMDASEPNLRDCQPMEYQKALTTPTALGPSTEYMNAYALVNAQAIYEGQRSVLPNRRVFQLTRSGYAGLQRYSTASWSGDIGTTWLDMRAQMAAGIGYSMSGIPYWGMDNGGFSVQSRFSRAMSIYQSTGEVTPDLEEWRELNTRWHQFGTFVPIFRTHGQWPARELWNLAPEGTETYSSILWYIKLRYRLMPYLYALAGRVNREDYTLMRGLVMDFPEDRAVRKIDDQWMFGPALMPCPVSEYQARSRSVYFPEGASWYDFYDGRLILGGQRLEVDAPYARMPLYVRAGSILPFGPEIQWSDEKPADRIDLFVYAGADGNFTLYEDDGLTYEYENGAFSEIGFRWDDASRKLTVSACRGDFPGKIQNRVFRVTVIDADHPVGYDPDRIPEGLEVPYEGQEITVQL